MPSNYDGKTGSITLPAPMTISSSTFSNPITITVTGTLPASFFTGAAPLVHISGHPINLPANGIWIATPTGPSTFTIPVAGIAASGGGTVQPIYVQNAYTLPSDGDADNAASVSAWGQSTGDRTQWLASRVGQFKLARREVFLNSNIGTTAWAHWPAGAVTIGNAVQFVGDAATWGTTIGSAVTLPVAGPGGIIFAIDGVVVGDYVRARLESSFVTPALHAVALYAANLDPTSSPVWPATWGRLGGASALFDSAGTGNPTTRGFMIEGAINVANVSGNIWIQPNIWPLTNDSPTLQLVGEGTLTIEIWRPTGMPQ